MLKYSLLLIVALEYIMIWYYVISNDGLSLSGFIRGLALEMYIIV